MKKLLLVLPFLILTACPKCDDPNGPPVVLANYISSQWACKNSTAVKSDVETWFASKKLCSKDDVLALEKEKNYTGIVANLVCPLLADALRLYAISKVPASWECDPTKIGADAAAAIVYICELAPF